MDSSSSHQSTAMLSKWHQVVLKTTLSEVDILRALNFSSSNARFVSSENGRLVIEILGTTDEDVAKSELQFRHALIDQQLRKEIDQKSSNRISEIVEAVICRVSGG